jgi:hypothetical protein
MEDQKPKFFTLQNLFAFTAVLIGAGFMFCGASLALLSILGKMNHLMDGILMTGIGVGIIMSFICISMQVGTINNLASMINLQSKILEQSIQKTNPMEFLGGMPIKFTSMSEGDVEEFETLEDLMKHHIKKATPLDKMKLEDLEALLETAVSTENWEKASEIRDELKRREEEN